LRVISYAQIFIGELPRQTTASVLASALVKKFGSGSIGSISYVIVMVDEGTKYQKGAARASFTSFELFVKAMANPFITVPNIPQPKCVSVSFIYLILI
jgi:hypothetical protein